MVFFTLDVQQLLIMYKYKQSYLSYSKLFEINSKNPQNELLSLP